MADYEASACGLTRTVGSGPQPITSIDRRRKKYLTGSKDPGLGLTPRQVGLPEDGQGNVDESQSAHAMRQANRDIISSLGRAAPQHGRDNDREQEDELGTDLQVIDARSSIAGDHFCDPNEQHAGDKLGPGTQMLPKANRRSLEGSQPAAEQGRSTADMKEHQGRMKNFHETTIPNLPDSMSVKRGRCPKAGVTYILS